MAIRRSHVPYHAEIFALPGFFSEPVLCFGFQDANTTAPGFEAMIAGRSRPPLLHALRKLGWMLEGLWYRVPEQFKEPDLNRILARFGVSQVDTLDMFDERATYGYDMNEPVPESLHGKYGTILDIGNTEHVFDTRTCLANLFRMLKVGGHLLIATPCNGFYGHGLHTFNPEAIRGAMLENGFKIVYLAYISKRGARLRHPNQRKNVNLWIVGRKLEDREKFEPPQQGGWSGYYEALRGKPSAAEHAPGPTSVAKPHQRDQVMINEAF
jgi:hypothetical protein